MINEYGEFDNLSSPYNTHGYLYYVAKKFNAVLLDGIAGQICRSTVPEGEINMEILMYHDRLYKIKAGLN
jgi:hypothetical protein